MPIRRNLEYHELGEKENLVTLQDRHGTFDRFRCINCGKEFRMRYMARPKKIYEPCYVSQAKFDEVMERRKAEVSGEVYGCWASLVVSVGRVIVSWWFVQRRGIQTQSFGS